MKIKTSLLLCILAFTSCSQIVLDSDIKAVVRVTKGATSSSGMPNFYINEEYKPKNYMSTTEVKKSPQRSIASVSEESKESVKDLSGKQVYFLSLYTQYLKMKNLLGKTGAEKFICPRFHNEILDYKSDLKILLSSVSQFKRKNYSSVINSPKELPFYPELSMPLSKGNKYNVYEYTKNMNTEMVQYFVRIAFEEHFLKNKNEIEELCEYGYSDNYYSYLNLINYFKSHPEFSSKIGSLKAVLKVPIFANAHLLNSLYVGENYEDANSLTYMKKFDHKILEIFNLSWVKEYNAQLREHQNQSLNYARVDID